MTPYDQAYADMMRSMPEPCKSRHGQTCEGMWSILAYGHASGVQVHRYPGCYKCAETRPAVCQPGYPREVARGDNRRCAPCQAEADRRTRERALKRGQARVQEASMTGPER
jgi:hypothetical protein